MIYVFIQARMGSTRLPGKVMYDICGKPVLWHIVERVKKSKHVDKIIVSTSINNDNGTIRKFCIDNSILCFSGNENDVLDRFYQTAKYNNVCQEDIIIRITADCPLIDPDIIDLIIEKFKEEISDYASNVLNPTFPDGLDCEVLKFSALENAWKNAKLNSEREHVTLYIRNHPKLFKLINFENEMNISSLRWTLDEERDFEFIKIIYNELYRSGTIFHMNEILDLLNKNPQFSKINSNINRNEGLLKSLHGDNVEN